METFPLTNLTVELVDEPAKNLSAERQRKIVDECIPVARAAFRNDQVTASDIIKHALEVPTGIYVSDQGGNIVAFTSSVVEELEGRKILYLEGTASQQRNSGLYGLLTGLRILHGVEQDPTADWLLSTRTQNPVVFRNMTLKYGLFPKLDAEPPDDIKQIVSAFACVVRENYSDFISLEFRFDANCLVHRRAYGSRDEETGEESGFCMYGPIDGDHFPWCDVVKEEHRERHAAINSFFRDKSKIDLGDGDAVLLMGRLDDQAIRAAQRDVVNSLAKVSPDDVEIREALAARFDRLTS